MWGHILVSHHAKAIHNSPQKKDTTMCPHNLVKQKKQPMMKTGTQMAETGTQVCAPTKQKPMMKTVKLGDVVTISPEGFKPDGSKQYYVGLEHIEKDTGQILENAKVDSISAIKNKFYSGEILYGKLRPYLNKATLATRDGVCSTDILVLRTKPNADSTYVLRYILSEKFVKDMSENVSGANLPRISSKFVLDYPIPLPSLPEQRRIAALLDRADSLRQKDRLLLTHYDSLAQSLFLDMFGDPVANEKGWDFVALRSQSNFMCDGPFGSNLKTEHYRPSGTRVIRLANVGVGRFLEKDEVFISTEHHEKNLRKNTCLPGDLVIATLGEPNLRSCIVPDNIGPSINKADVILFRPNNKQINSQYLNGLINHSSMLNLASKLMHGQTRVRISMGQLASLKIPVPPLELQTKFAELIGQIEAQKAVVRQQMAASEGLFSRLLQDCFGG